MYLRRHESKLLFTQMKDQPKIVIKVEKAKNNSTSWDKFSIFYRNLDPDLHSTTCNHVKYFRSFRRFLFVTEQILSDFTLRKGGILTKLLSISEDSLEDIVSKKKDSTCIIKTDNQAADLTRLCYDKCSGTEGPEV